MHASCFSAATPNEDKESKKTNKKIFFIIVKPNARLVENFKNGH